jgi:MOSC domain-containing protein YiiM
VSGAGSAVVTAVSRSPAHGVRKGREKRITLLAGLGVEGDAHLGETVKHRSRARRDPAAPNLRQVHLLHAELHDELREQGFEIAAGEMGENVTTRRVDLLGLPTRARLRLGADAVLEITGLRNPCAQLDELGPGLMRATLGRGEGGALVRKAGVMAIVVHGGLVAPGDAVVVQLPPPPHETLRPV